MAGPAAFVGREGELSRLAGALGGDARLVLVAGDAGVGKTRFAGEGMARAATAGMVMVRGECLPLAGTLPLLPVAAALGELAGLDGGGLLAAALEAAPPYVRAEVGRLLPGLGSDGGPGRGGPGEGWPRERLFAAVAELLAVVAGRSGSGAGLVVEDVHWADSATLDFLTYLAWPGRRGAVTVVATCRGDEAPRQERVAGWLADVRGAAGVAEIRLGPLSRAEAAQQVAALAGGPVPPRVAEELYARSEGNPFFTEQLVAAGLADGEEGGLAVPAGLPGRLAELLKARAARCAGDAQTVLAGLAVAGRPLAEDLLAAVTGLGAEAVRRGLRELAAARLLAEDTTGGAHRPRHALLAEAVAGGLLPGERAGLHERTARALAAAGDQALAAEVAGHWQAADRPVEELPARVTAAEAAERVFGYAEAAAHWQRAIELFLALPDSNRPAGTDLPQMYARAIDALQESGDGHRAGELAEQAFRRFADHPDPATAAVVHQHAAFFRGIEEPDAGFPLIEEALRLFEPEPPSADKAKAWFYYATVFLIHGQGQEATLTALRRALDIAEAADATALVALILPWLAHDAFLRGRVEEGFAIIDRGDALAEASGDGAAILALAMIESDALLKTGKFESAVQVALRGLQTARQTGRQASWHADVLAGNAAEALLAQGRTAEAAVLIDPLTAGPPDRDHWMPHEYRAEIDLLRGDIAAAAERLQQINECTGRGNIWLTHEVAQRAAEIALWAGRPGDALAEVRRVLALYTVPHLTILCGRLLTAGMRACADLAERARARRDHPAATTAAQTAADGLASWAEQVSGGPFTDHPYVATIPADRATWNAEQTRLAGRSDPDGWSTAAKTWDGLGCPHRAGYAWWRQAEAQLNSGQPAAAAAGSLRAAPAAAEGHAPLLARVRALAERARIPLQAPAATADTPGTAAAAKVSVPFGLTGRELAVLRLLAAGRTNAQIGAELYISPKTASVHVTSIFRKLGVSGRVQAAALAERAGLLQTQH
jgi:DNA-binding CsgD family transcriptional regulator/tetratricopeptide (TPR) repeat protein